MNRLIQRRSPAATVLAAIVLAAAVIVAMIGVVQFVDYPLALAVARLHLAQSTLQGPAVQLPVMIVLAAAGVAAGVTYLVRKKPIPKWATAAMLAGLSLLGSVVLVAFVLKPLFGRAGPGEFLAHCDTGFFWFDRNGEHRSFPSGHSSQAAALLSVLWLLYPRWRWAYAGAFVVLAAALIVGEWHFLGDILAGGLIGAAGGTLAVQLWEKSRAACR